MQEQLNLFSDRAIQTTDASILGFAAGLDSVVDKWRTDITTIVSGGNLTPREMQKLGNIVALQVDLQKALNRAGYPELLGKLIGSYDRNRETALSMLDAAGYQTKRLAPLNSAALSSLKKMDYRYLSDLGSSAVAEISRQVTQNAIAGQPRRRMIEAADKVLTSKFRPHAATYADTALTSYDRRLHLDLWREAGVKRLLYRGPADIKNRAFCSSHVGKTYTLPEIQGMRNGTGPEPPLYYGGGWNCRHVWVMAAPTAEEVGDVAAQQERDTIAARMARSNPTKYFSASVQSMLADTAGSLQLPFEEGYGTGLIVRGVTNFRTWIRAMVERCGESVRTVSQRLFTGAKALLADTRGALVLPKVKEPKTPLEKLYDKTWGVAKKVEPSNFKNEYKPMIEAAIAGNPDTAKLLKELDTWEKVHVKQAAIFEGAGLKKPPWLTTHETQVATWKKQLQTFEPAPAPVPVAAPKPAPPAAPPPPPKVTLPVTAAAVSGEPAAVPITNPMPAGHDPKKWYDKVWGQAKKFEALKFKDVLVPLVEEKLAAAGTNWAALETQLTAQQAAHVKMEKHFAASGLIKPGWLLKQEAQTAKWLDQIKAKTGIDEALLAEVAAAKAENEALKAAAAVKTKPKPSVTPITPPQTSSDWTAADLAWNDHPPQFEKAPNQPTLGGAHEKAVYLDESGNSWLFKPVDASKRVIPFGEEGAWKIARNIDPNAVEVRTVTINGRFGSVQRLRTDLAAKKDFTAGAGNTPVALSTLTPAELQQIQREHVIDWLTSNHDGHPGQFLRTIGGDVIGIDKAQAYKHLGQDKLSIAYHPNAAYGEQEPFYNTIGRAVKQGTLAIEPGQALPWIRRAEAISDDEMRRSLLPYAKARFPTQAEVDGFIKQAIGRRNSLRTDFESYYSDLTGKPFQFEPQAVPKPAAKPKTTYQVLDDKQAARVAIAKERRAQGRALAWDTDAIEDHNLLLWQEDVSGSPISASTFKVRPDVQEAILTRLGIDPKHKPQTAAAAALKPKWELSDLELLPITKSGPVVSGYKQKAYTDPATGKQHTITSQQLFVKLVKGETPTNWVNGYQTALTATEIAAVKAEAALYLDRAAAYRKSITPAPTAPKPAAAPSTALGYTVTISKPTIDTKRLSPGGKVSLLSKNDAFASSTSVTPHSDLFQVNVTWDDGTTLRWMPHVETANRHEYKAYAHQGVIRLSTAGELTPQRADGMLAKLNDLGITSRPPTLAEQEGLYLKQTAVAAKVEGTPDWKKAAAKGVDGMREYWTKKLGRDIAADPQYNPEGHSFNWSGAGEGGWQQRERFDITRAELDAKMKGYALHHTLSGDMAAFFRASLDKNAGIVATTERVRQGVPLTGMSPTADQHSGGADYVFTRIRKSGTSEGLYFKKELLLRADTMSFDSDYYGETIGPYPQQRRAANIAEWLNNGGRWSNETIVKHGLSYLHDIDYIKAPAHERDEIIDLFRKAGYAKLPDGRAIEKVVR